MCLISFQDNISEARQDIQPYDVVVEDWKEQSQPTLAALFILLRLSRIINGHPFIDSRRPYDGCLHKLDEVVQYN